ncbi:MAG: adenine deaminase [Desulfobacca sp.]|uniref:adenine deaminase n=1 Tax=Desulfobacca sp. TaxID=2067990 RepID=UPI00404947D9
MSENAKAVQGAAQLERLIQVATGRSPADLVLRGGWVADVFQGRLVRTDVALVAGVIVGWGEYEGPELEVSGQVICPGLIDGHIHLESTLLSPPEFARAVVPQGTTAVVADPHEIVNVAGVAGLEYILAFQGRLPLDLFVLLPSCVPASPFETNGAAFDLAELKQFRGHPGVLGLAEVMNFPGVVQADPNLLAKIALFQGAVIDGHAPGLADRELNAYRLAGIASDHESTTLTEAQERLARGFYLMIREGSTAHNMAALWPVVTPAAARRLMLVSDDLHPEDLQQRGHLPALQKKAQALGCDPLTALTLVTLNPAEYFRLFDRGAVAPGYRADLVVVDSLETFRVQTVIKDGKIVASAGRLLAPLSLPGSRGPQTPLQVKDLSPQTFSLPAAGDLVKVIGLIPGQILTQRLLMATPVQDGLVQADSRRDILKLAVLERHRGSGRVGLGLVHGFGLQRGALASTVAHDSHNLIVVGVTDTDMFLAAQHLVELGGGLAVAVDGRIVADLPLPIAGLMSLASLEEVTAGQAALQEACRALGSALPDPFMALSFLALPVIPQLKLTDQGLVDVERFALVPLFGE